MKNLLVSNYDLFAALGVIGGGHESRGVLCQTILRASRADFCELKLRSPGLVERPLALRKGDAKQSSCPRTLLLIKMLRGYPVHADPVPQAGALLRSHNRSVSEKGYVHA